MTGAVLSVRGLTRRFGGLSAVDDVSFEVRAGEILGVIGPNGAGKTTTFNLIAGALKPSSGEILLEGEAVAGLPSNEVARRGVIRTFQHNAPFVGMPVIDNVLVGAHLRLRSPLVSVVLATRSTRDREAAARAEACRLLDEVGLAGARDKQVGELSFGQGRLLEIARGLAGHPRIMLFDEPAAGLTPPEMRHLAALIRSIAARGISVLLIEHDMRFLLPLVDRAVVLNFGRKIADDAPAGIRANRDVVEAYLGAQA